MSDCLMCNFVEGKSEARKLYEDKDVLCILNPTPATFGHSLVMTKKHLPIITQVEDNVAKKIFFIAQQISTMLFEAINTEGTNILIHNGAVAGQKHAHLLVHIIPRSKDDGLSFEWPKKQLPEKSMNEIHEMLEVPEERKELKREPVKEGEKGPIKEVSYRVKQLRRIP